MCELILPRRDSGGLMDLPDCMGAPAQAAFLLMRPSVDRERSEMPPMMTRSAETVTAPVPAGGELSPTHVLIVDGNTLSREDRLAELRATGLRVSSARTGFEAIVKASCQVPDVILIEESLPDMEASEAGRLITTCPVTAHIPVIPLDGGGALPARLLSILRHGSR
jgi:CheY-like chemotaxis protein